MKIAAGYDHSLAILANGFLVGWGYNVDGRVGDGSTSSRFEPVFVTGIPADPLSTIGSPNVQAIAAGFYHSLAVDHEGKVWAWGSNGNGQLGIGSVGSFYPVPQQVAGALLGKVVSKVVAGEKHSLAVTDTGELYTWGDNVRGELGASCSPLLASSTPLLVPPPAGTQWSEIGTAQLVSYAVRAGDQRGRSWGNNITCQLGIPGDIGPPPVPPVPDSNVHCTPAELVNVNANITHISGGWQSAAARTTDNAVYTWGANQSGELGDGNPDDAFVDCIPDALAGIAATSVCAGYRHTLAVTTTARVRGWGTNNRCQLATSARGGPFPTLPWSDVGGYNTPQPVYTLFGTPPTELDNVSAVAAGDGHSLAMRIDGSVMSWGSNAAGQLGNDTAGNSCIARHVKHFDPGDPETIPPPLGNVLKAVKRDYWLPVADQDVFLDWEDAAGPPTSFGVWRVSKGDQKDLIGNFPLSPYLRITEYLHVDAVIQAPTTFFYCVSRLSPCSFTPSACVE